MWGAGVDAWSIWHSEHYYDQITTIHGSGRGNLEEAELNMAYLTEGDDRRNRGIVRCRTNGHGGVDFLSYAVWGKRG